MPNWRAILIMLSGPRMMVARTRINSSSGPPMPKKLSTSVPPRDRRQDDADRVQSDQWQHDQAHVDGVNRRRDDGRDNCNHDDGMTPVLDQLAGLDELELGQEHDDQRHLERQSDPEH